MMRTASIVTVTTHRTITFTTHRAQLVTTDRAQQVTTDRTITFTTHRGQVMTDRTITFTTHRAQVTTDRTITFTTHRAQQVTTYRILATVLTLTTILTTVLYYFYKIPIKQILDSHTERMMECHHAIINKLEALEQKTNGTYTYHPFVFALQHIFSIEHEAAILRITYQSTRHHTHTSNPAPTGIPPTTGSNPPSTGNPPSTQYTSAVTSFNELFIIYA